MIKMPHLYLNFWSRQLFRVSLVSLFGYNFKNMKKALKHKIQEGLDIKILFEISDFVFSSSNRERQRLFSRFFLFAHLDENVEDCQIFPRIPPDNILKKTIFLGAVWYFLPQILPRKKWTLKSRKNSSKPGPSFQL